MTSLLALYLSPASSPDIIFKPKSSPTHGVESSSVCLVCCSFTRKIFFSQRSYFLVNKTKNSTINMQTEEFQQVLETVS